MLAERHMVDRHETFQTQTELCIIGKNGGFL
jgi:hypothetical protein